MPSPFDRSNLLAGRRWAAVVAALTMAITLIPYLAGLTMTNGRQFMWLGYNLDDSCVYLSWIRQSADGALKTLNLFTTSPQHGMAPNPLFWFLGRFASVTHLPLIAVYHLSRIVCGFGLLITAWDLIRILIQPHAARRLAFLFICFSAGLGWLPIWTDGSQQSPVDMWQPEAVTFLSLYLSPLFCFSMMLQVAVVMLLLLGERTQEMRYPVYAGLCGFLLGMTHTYDVITMAAVWTVYLAVTTAIRSRQRVSLRNLVVPWIRGMVAGLITLPAVAYIAFQLKSESVFRDRANVATLAPALYWILLGYGVTLLLAVLGAAVTGRHAISKQQPAQTRTDAETASAWTTGRDATLLLITWTVTNVACAYVPVAFQRKMLQGAHIPIAMLAGVGAAWILTHIPLYGPLRRFPAFATTAVLLLGLTNLRFMRRDIDNFTQNLAQTGLHRTYLQPGEMKALEWLRANTAPSTGVQPLPWVGLRVNESDNTRQIYAREATLMCFTPGLINRPVYCGHWGETPQFSGKLAELKLFATRLKTDAERIQLLRFMHVRYLVFSQKRAADNSYQAAEDADEAAPMFRHRIPVPNYLRLVYSNLDADVYEVLIN